MGKRERGAHVPCGMLLSIVWVMVVLFVGATLLGRLIEESLGWAALLLWAVPLVPTVTALLQGEYPWTLYHVAWLYALNAYDLASNVLAIVTLMPLLAWMVLGGVGGALSMALALATISAGLKRLGVSVDAAFDPSAMWPYMLLVWGGTLFVALSYRRMRAFSDSVADLVQEGRAFGLHWIARRLSRR